MSTMDGIPPPTPADLGLDPAAILDTIDRGRGIHGSHAYAELAAAFIRRTAHAERVNAEALAVLKEMRQRYEGHSMYPPGSFTSFWRRVDALVKRMEDRS